MSLTYAVPLYGMDISVKRFLVDNLNSLINLRDSWCFENNNKPNGINEDDQPAKPEWCNGDGQPNG